MATIVDPSADEVNGDSTGGGGATVARPGAATPAEPRGVVGFEVILGAYSPLARIFVPSIATVPNLPSPAQAAITYTCANKSLKRHLRLRAEPCDRRVVRAVLGAQHPERHIGQ